MAKADTRYRTGLNTAPRRITRDDIALDVSSIGDTISSCREDKPGSWSVRLLSEADNQRDGSEFLFRC
jgi:hypothetical protein